MYHPDHDINNVVMTLINEGSLYQQHLRLARSKKSNLCWRVHIRTYYRFHQTQLPQAKMHIAADIMKRYYEEHVTEM